MKNNLDGDYCLHRFKPSKTLLKITTVICSFLKRKNIILQEYTGPQNTYYDFKTVTGETVSIKTNFNWYKVCPQNIGQISKEKWMEKFGHVKGSNDHKTIFMTNKEIIIREYWRNLFPCDHNIWVRYGRKKWRVTYIPKRTSTIFSGELMTTTRTLENWKESNTVKCNGVSIGEIQIHNNRNCIKFRFNLLNCIKFIVHK